MNKKIELTLSIIAQKRSTLEQILFSKGQKIHKTFINFSTIFVYFGLLLFLFIIVAENFEDLKNSLLLSLNYENFFSKKNIYPLISVTGTLFAYFSIKQLEKEIY